MRLSFDLLLVPQDMGAFTVVYVGTVLENIILVQTSGFPVQVV